MTKSETKSTVLLKHHLKTLKLPTMHHECEKIAQRCAADNADHLAYLLQLSELELIERERKAAERRLKAARFPAAKLLDEFDFAARPSVNKPLVLQLIQGDYLDQRENVLLVGPSGTGKSHLATALGMAACAQGKRVRFFRVTELITQLLEAKEERQLLRYRQALNKLDLLVLDELGYVPASKAGAELLFDVIATAYERNSLIVTTNLPFENWTEVLGSERLTGALLIRELVAVFCSIRCPGNEILKLYDLARGLRDAGVGVISGFHTPMEKECLVTLLRGTQPIVICPARSLHRMRIPQEWRTGIDAGRLALVSAFPSSVARASRETAATRNHLVAALASKVVIAYAEPGGQTSKLAEELTKAGRKPLNLDAEELRPYRPG